MGELFKTNRGRHSHVGGNPKVTCEIPAYAGMTKWDPLPPSFYEGSTVQIAKKLLGTYLLHKNVEGLTVGRIVETEAYLADDPACHASRGQTPRNAPMFGPPGHAYVYFIYGMYHCFNVVTASKGIGEAVLIRALEPIEGIDLMQKRRAKGQVKSFLPQDLCNGPSKLVIAMGLTKEHNTLPLFDDFLCILSKNHYGDQPDKQNIVTTTRIGLKKGCYLPLRFYIKDHPSVSRKT